MRQRALFWIALTVVLLAIWLAYKPGLAGDFLFDDFANLPSLGATGPIDNGPALARYLTSSTADPTGRPVTVASFLLNAHDWPADPRPFKETNLLIHLLNVVLLAGLLLILGRRSGLENRHAQGAAILGATLWGLHPLFVSTTLYIVQREAMLPLSFTLLGLMTWLAGRERLIRGQQASGLTLEILGLGLGTLLATFSKANGALLPLFALLIEHLLLRPRDTQELPRAHRFMIWLLWLPTLAVIAYLLNVAIALLGGPAPFGRDWTEGQRLLTQPRVLCDYLRLLWLPRPFTAGLFNDQIRASTSLLEPITTLPALLFVLGTIIGAWLMRRRAPLLALGILFFFVGQLIESTSIPLELYFEHRNYLPAILLFWPLAIWLLKSGETQKPRIILACIFLCGLGWMTHARATVWGDTTEQAVLWAQLNPESPRAQANAAQIMTERGHPDWAQPRLRTLLRKTPNEIQIAFNLLGADCHLEGVTPDDLAATRHALSNTRRLGALSLTWLGKSIRQAKDGSCKGLTMPAIKSLIDAAWENPVVRDTPSWQQDLLNLRGKYALAEQQPQIAFQYFAAALKVDPNPASALEQAAVLGTAGQQKLALCQLELLEHLPEAAGNKRLTMARLHEWVLQRQNYWPHEVSSLKASLTVDMPPDQNNAACPLVKPTDNE